MHAIRRLLRAPGFLAIALATLALGIGVNTAMFSVVRTLVFGRVPYPEPGRLVEVSAVVPEGARDRFSLLEHREIRERTAGFAALTVIGTSYDAVGEPGQPSRRVPGIRASADFFATFGVQPALGRAFTVEETQPGRDGVIVISHRSWQRRFDGAPDIIGRQLRIDGHPVEIIGVMPPGFDYPLLWQTHEYWRPLAPHPDEARARGLRLFRLIGRLAPRATPEQVSAELAPVAAEQALHSPEGYTGLRYHVQALHATLATPADRQVAWMLAALSGFVLLIACANLAHLQLARCVAGQRDLAIRAALGGSRRRLVFQQVQESMLVALAGGALGTWVAVGLNRVVSIRLLGGVRAGTEVPLDGTVLACTMVVTLGAGLLLGLAPALVATRMDLNHALRQHGRGNRGGRAAQRVRRGLIAAEVALACVLLGGAATMQRGLTSFFHQDNGWDTNRVITAGLCMPPRYATPEQRNAYIHRLEERLRSLPGVEQATLATSLPVFGSSSTRRFLRDGQGEADFARLPSTSQVLVTPGYFDTLGIPLLAGRTFNRHDGPDTHLVAIVNESLARHLWGDDPAVGRRVATVEGDAAVWYEVVGVARDVRDAAAFGPPETPFTLYRAMTQQPWPWIFLAVRSAHPETLPGLLRRAAFEVDADVPVDLVATVPQMIDSAQEDLRTAAQLVSAFAGLGLLLAVLGIYGVISHLVAQRTSEFGLRLALGASRRSILGLVLRHALGWTAVGLAFGSIGTLALTRTLGATLPRLIPLDTGVLVVVGGVLLLAAGVASLLPARRAIAVDPAVTLRAE